MFAPLNRCGARFFSRSYVAWILLLKPWIRENAFMLRIYIYSSGKKQERMLLGSRRLAKAFSMEKDEKNEKIAFSNMINTLQVMHFF